MELVGMLRTGEAARRLGISQEALRSWVRRGKIRCVETPFGRLFERGEVNRLAVERAVMAGRGEQEGVGS